MSQYTGFDRGSGGSSPVSMQSGFHHESDANNTDFLNPPAENPARNLYSGILNRSPGRDIFGKKGGKSIKDFTQDWINQYLSGQPRTERSNWLSDDSGSEAPSFITAQNQYADDDWLGLEGDIREEDLLKTPTLADFVGRRRLAGQAERSVGDSNSKDPKHQRTDTLRQEDFWGFAYDKDPQPISMLDTKNIPPPNDSEDKKAASPVDKPLPPPPSDTANPTPSTEPLEGSSNPKLTENTSRESSVPASQRPKKKVAWRGKNCIIALPLVDKRGTEESGYRLLSAGEVNEQLKAWEEKGYDTRGFSISTEEDPLGVDTLASSSRPQFPDPAELQEVRENRNFAVSFPNKGEWDAYVNFLQEEKLRALGVSLGDEEEKQPSVSPASASMSQMGPFPGLIASPPIPTASAASNPLAVGHPFSPHLNQSANPSTGVGSITSPASPFNVQTPLLGVDQNMLSRFPIQFQPTPPAQGTLTPQSLLQAQQAGGASSLPSSVPNLPSVLSPVSPFNEHGAFHPGLNDAPALPKSGIDTQSMRPHTPVDPNPQPDNFHASSVEIAHPTPRGHGHNVSETLQRGLDQFGQTDYHLEESIERQFDEHEQNNPHSDLLQSRWAIPKDVHSAQQQNHSLYQNDQLFGGNGPVDNGHEASDIDTNPSLSGTPQGPFAKHGPWDGPQPGASGHQSKLSASSFNVGAAEFDPMGSFSSNNFPLQSNSFQLPGVGQPAYSFGAGSGFPPANSFNISAPAFTSGGLNNQKSTGQSEFKFSSASFNVDAPVFNPNSSINSTGSAQESSGKTKIFGDLDLSQISKPNKKSKAIPIVRPDEKEHDDNERNVENEGTQHSQTDRHKRARRGDERSDGKGDVRMSPQALSENHNAQASQGSNMLHPPAEGKENAAPNNAGDGHDLADAKTIAAADDMPAERKGTPDSEASTWAVRSETKNEEEAAGPAVSDSPAKHGENSKKREAPVDKQPEPEQSTVRENTPSTDSKEGQDKPAKEVRQPAKRASIFERISKPFRFKPSVTEFVPTSQEPPKPAPQPAKQEQNDLRASRFAPKSPPASVKPEASPVEPTKLEPVVKEPIPEVKEPKSEQGVDNGSAEHSPNEEELNAIMEQLNDGSDVGIERQDTPLPPSEAAQPAQETPMDHRLAPTKTRSPAPSPSPRRVHEINMPNVPRAGTDVDARTQLTPSPQKGFISGMQSPVRQLVNENDHISDWDDVIFSGEEDKLINRSRFFDRRINDLVGSAIEERFTPFERALSAIQHSVMSIAAEAPKKSTLRNVSADVEDSDADDEDEEDDVSYRTRSPLNQRDRKFDKLKSVILDALASRETPHQAKENPTSSEIAQLHESFAELQALTMQQLSHDPMPNMRAAMQEIVSAQLSKQNARPSDAEEIGADSLMLQIDGLKNMLRVADSRAEAEYRQRREAQDSVAELQRLLKVAENEAARHCEAAESAEARFLQFKTEKIPYFEKIQFRADSLNDQHETLKLTLAEVSSKNITLEGSLDEYRVNSDHWKRDLEETKAQNKKLYDTIDHLKMRVEDGVSIRQNLTEKFDRIQDDMTTVQRDFARDQASWRKREEEHIAKYNELRASYNREVKLREKLESDVSELEQQEREAAKLKFIFGQSQQENARLEEMVANLRLENNDLADKAARYEREFNEARESSRVEIQRTRTSLESDLDAANNQVNIVRAELEAQIIRLQGQLDNVRLDADTARERYEMLLEEANESKAAATESKEVSMDEQRKLHERALNDLRERHARALHNSSEDRQRTESHLMDRLALSDEKVQHLQDRVHHLEEKLEITKSAARAAAEAAQGKGAPSVSPMHSTSPSMSYTQGSTVPEKISPQALRESILVLQDQLQQREARIEGLEQEVSSVDKDAPNKLKEKDTEINWLRELLGVRTDDLQDIINNLSKPSIDHNAVRDAAIRLKANLQMQLQEGERVLSGQSFPSLRSISELTASPRSLPLAAAAAWGSWRKGREHASSNASEQTPSKPSNAGAFLSGLLTPPASSVRQNLNTSAPSSATMRRTSQSRPLRGHSSTPRPLSARGPMFEPPKTPPLLRRANYDHDAEPTNYEHGDIEEDGESTTDGLVAASPREAPEEHEPFGPQISALNNSS